MVRTDLGPTNDSDKISSDFEEPPDVRRTIFDIRRLPFGGLWTLILRQTLSLV